MAQQPLQLQDACASTCLLLHEHSTTPSSLLRANAWVIPENVAGRLQADVGRLRDQELELKRKLHERVATGERLVAERAKELTVMKRDGGWQQHGVATLHGSVCPDHCLPPELLLRLTGEALRLKMLPDYCLPPPLVLRLAGEALRRKVLELERENTRQKQALKAATEEASSAHRQLKEMQRSQVIGIRRVQGGLQGLLCAGGGARVGSHMLTVQPCNDPRRLRPASVAGAMAATPLPAAPTAAADEG
jgi:hypothetical protein